jgi:hypothetical protein
MAKHNRDEEKKRRRRKRLERKQRQQTASSRPQEDPEGGLNELQAVLARLQNSLQVPEPAHWPGGGHPSLDRPDRVKFELAEFASGTEPGKTKCQQLERALQQGLLGYLPQLDHWGMEEFFWHGVPGDSWHPVEAFLSHSGDRFPPAAREQLRLWKQARIGLFEVGDIRDDTVTLQEWDAVTGTATGVPFRAITLNIGGVNIYRGLQGRINLTHVAPWVPGDNLFCGMGYGLTVDKRDAAALLLMYLGLRHLEVVARPLPWKANRGAAEQHLRAWRVRDWQSWLGERLRFPFLALVNIPPQGYPQLHPVESLIPETAAEARQFGIYLEVNLGRDPLVAGATNITPVDVTSPNAAALAEYLAYRTEVGPPPGTKGRPNYFRLP